MQAGPRSAPRRPLELVARRPLARPPRKTRSPQAGGRSGNGRQRSVSDTSGNGVGGSADIGGSAGADAVDEGTGGAVSGGTGGVGAGSCGAPAGVS